MSVDKIKELLELMKENDLVEMELEEGDFHVRLKKPGANLVTGVPQMTMTAPVAAAPAPAAAAAPELDPGLTPIPSPIVGTFYSAPSPDAPPFVSVGSDGKRRDRGLHCGSDEDHERGESRIFGHDRKGHGRKR